MLARTNENYLRWKFGHWVVKGYTPNVTLVAPGQDAGIALEPGESPIAWVALVAASDPLLLTDVRLIQSGQALVRFDDVAACIWIDRDDETAAKLKTEKFHRLILELREGREVVIEGLGQAVFPLLNFFWNKLGRYSGRAAVG
ncbi:hypothetical protein [Humisphaera borealis]|uniref:Uncharacterized protein n=1 Tax=Humisphaera borealis TaxID=2807512 RepID=A0A7M2WZ80_9BACT|nr:hypothetical protein [Humisphaera borealis]QOV90161.1 hypothetical protein IPV69_01945 [Humisphaera borealis]